MNVSLTPHFEAMIREKVESGRYNNASEVVRQALRLLEDRDRRELERLAAIAAGRNRTRLAEDENEAPPGAEGA